MKIIVIINPHDNTQRGYANIVRERYGTYLEKILEFTPQVQNTFGVRATPAIVLLPDALQGAQVMAEGADGDLLIDAALAQYYDQDEAAVHDTEASRYDQVVRREVETVAEPLRESIQLTKEALAQTFTAEAEEMPAALAHAAQIAGIETDPNGSPWLPGRPVYVGAVRLYNGIEYQVIQAHITQADWTPDLVPALWKRYSGEGDPSTSRPWVEGESVESGWIRSYKDKDYRCIQSHTTQADWTPLAIAALWQPVE